MPLLPQFLHTLFKFTERLCSTLLLRLPSLRAVVDQAADKAERYRCNAAHCIRLTQVAPIACRRFLLEMARAWHNLADQVERNDKADLVYEPAQLRSGTQRVTSKQISPVDGGDGAPHRGEQGAGRRRQGVIRGCGYAVSGGRLCAGAVDDGHPDRRRRRCPRSQPTAFRAIRRYSGGNARAWVLTIVRNTALTWMAKSRPVALVVVDDLAAVERRQVQSGNMDDWNCGVDPETEVIAKADAARLETAIGSLPSPFRETLVLRDLQGLDYREISQVTDSDRDGHVPPGAGASAIGRNGPG